MGKRETLAYGVPDASLGHVVHEGNISPELRQLSKDLNALANQSSAEAQAEALLAGADVQGSEVPRTAAPWRKYVAPGVDYATKQQDRGRWINIQWKRSKKNVSDVAGHEAPPEAYEAVRTIKGQQEREAKAKRDASVGNFGEALVKSADSRIKFTPEQLRTQLWQQLDAGLQDVINQSKSLGELADKLKTFVDKKENKDIIGIDDEIRTKMQNSVDELKALAVGIEEGAISPDNTQLLKRLLARVTNNGRNDGRGLRVQAMRLAMQPKARGEAAIKTVLVKSAERPSKEAGMDALVAKPASSVTKKGLLRGLADRFLGR